MPALDDKTFPPSRYAVPHPPSRLADSRVATTRDRGPMSLAAAGRPRTKQEFVYHTLRAGIMRCDLAPGERLVIDELARRLHVSIIPVREALQVLQSEGLIVNTPHVGASVAPITRESILDVFTLLEGVETVATRLVAERGNPEELDRVDALVREMDGEIESGRLERWAELNTAFHLEISAMPGLRLLNETTARVLDNWHRVRRFYFKGVLQLRAAQAQQEHHQMAAAMRARNLPQLADVVRRHSRGALCAYMGFLDDTAGALVQGAGTAPR
jgi:DNA-binding GntR family transcriptional regulator